jgi:hypothetical protein
MTTPAIDENRTSIPDHVIVGIDIGHTCTGGLPVLEFRVSEAEVGASRLFVVGVAIYSHNPPSRPGPTVVQKWPGSNEFVNKVPTAITYRAGSLRPLSWGLACPKPGEIGPGICVKRLFKFFLDENFLQEMKMRNPDGVPGEIDDVRMWYRDFLSSLHEHILTELEAPYQVDSKLTKLEYVFSLPTAWKEKGKLAKEFGDILKQAGFGDGENSSVAIGITEAEASAVQAAVSRGCQYKVRWTAQPHDIR